MIYGTSMSNIRYNNSTIYNEADLNVRADFDSIPTEFTSFSELALFVAEGAESDYNEMMQSIGIHELAVFESTGRFIVYEEVEAETLSGKAVNLFKKIWQKIKAAFSRVVQWFDDRKHTKDVAFIGKTRGKITDAIEKFAKSDPSHKFGSMHMIIQNSRSMPVAVDGAKTAMNKAKNMLSGLNKDSDIGEIKQEQLDSLVEAITGFKGSNFNEIKSDFRNSIMQEDETEITVKYLLDNNNFVDQLAENVLNQTTYRRAIKKAYNDEKKLIDDAITLAKNKRASAKKDKVDYMVKGYAAQISIYKEIIVCLHSCSSLYLDVLKRNYNESKMLLMRMANAADNLKQTKANESYDYYDDGRSVIETAFDW